MRIVLRRSGGLVGASTERSIETDSLDAAAAAQIERLVRALPPAGCDERSTADGFQYDITIDDPTLGSRTYRFLGDPNPASTLIEDLQRLKT